jgi:prepilin-type N-terminal cleavage/methylation domain-containing protein
MTICHSQNSAARRRSARGFTIIEVMMASVILVVAFMGMIQAITLGSEMLATARRQTLASQIIEHEIGQLRLKSWGSMPASGSATITINDSYANGLFKDAIASCGLTYSNLSLSMATTNLDGLSDSATTFKDVTFTLTWTATPSSAAAARTYTRKATAFFGKYGLNQSIQRS